MEGKVVCECSTGVVNCTNNSFSINPIAYRINCKNLLSKVAISGCDLINHSIAFAKDLAKNKFRVRSTPFPQHVG